MTPRSALAARASGIAIACLSTACAQVIGSDSYTITAKTQTATKKNDAEKSSFAPAPAFPSAPGCEACIEENCRSDMDTCLSDGTCSEIWHDLAANSDPNAAYGRYLTEGPAGLTASEGNGRDFTANLRICAITSCRDTCRMGENFSCVGRFDWDVTPPSTLSVLLRDGSGDPASPWATKACEVADGECDNPVETELSDAIGFVRLSNLTEQPVTRIGFLSFEGDASFPRWTGLISRPLTEGDITEWNLPNTKAIEDGFAALGATYDPGYSILLVSPFDCAGLDAKNVKMDVLLQGPNGLEPCDTCQYAYPTDDNVPVTSLTAYTTSKRDGVVANVQARSIILRLKNVGDGSVVAVVPFQASAGWGHRVRVYPASKSELDAARQAGALDL